MRVSRRKTVFYAYPVELVWRALGAGERREMEPMSEDEFDSREPAPGTIFTRLIEMKENELFAFRMKAAGFITDMRIEMKATAPCETRVLLSQDVEYRTAAAYIFSGFGSMVRKELNHFAMDLRCKLADGRK